MVQLLESAAFGLRETKEAEQRTEAADTRENEPNLAAEVSLVLVDEERDTKSQGYGADLVEG